MELTEKLGLEKMQGGWIIWGEDKRNKTEVDRANDLPAVEHLVAEYKLAFGPAFGQTWHIWYEGPDGTVNDEVPSAYSKQDLDRLGGMGISG
jgi:hypothetical protein